MLEEDLISNYMKKLVKNNTFALNLNDDVFFDKSNNLALSLDTYNEKVHFPNFKFPDLVIQKVLRSSLSDLICKGVKPKYYFLSASGPKNVFNKKNMKKIKNVLQREQKKYKIKISGGDTTVSKILSFTVVVLGFNNKIIERNKSNINDDIYVTGNLGDSNLGLQIIKNKLNIDSLSRKYFINKYYCPDLPFNFIKTLNSSANSSIDISDGLIDDMKKLINQQNYSFHIDLNKIPISNKLKSFLISSRRKKQNYIFHGDDYQILFTSSKKNRKKIIKSSKILNQKVTLIGEIVSKSYGNVIHFGKKRLNLRDFKGYSHKF